MLNIYRLLIESESLYRPDTKQELKNLSKHKRKICIYFLVHLPLLQTIIFTLLLFHGVGGGSQHKDYYFKASKKANVSWILIGETSFALYGITTVNLREG